MSLGTCISEMNLSALIGADALNRVNMACNSKLQKTFEPRHEKTSILVFDLVQHKPGCTATEDGQRLEILDLESRGITLSM